MGERSRGGVRDSAVKTQEKKQEEEVTVSQGGDSACKGAFTDQGRTRGIKEGASRMAQWVKALVNNLVTWACSLKLTYWRELTPQVCSDLHVGTSACGPTPSKKHAIKFLKEPESFPSDSNCYDFPFI